MTREVSGASCLQVNISDLLTPSTLTSVGIVAGCIIASLGPILHFTISTGTITSISLGASGSTLFIFSCVLKCCLKTQKKEVSDIASARPSVPISQAHDPKAKASETSTQISMPNPMFDQLNEERKKIKKLDLPIKNMGWQAFGKAHNHETPQTFEHISGLREEPYTLILQAIGNVDTSCLNLVADYLEAFHSIKVEISTNQMQMRDVKRKLEKVWANLTDEGTRLNYEGTLKNDFPNDENKYNTILLLNNGEAIFEPAAATKVLAFTDEKLYADGLKFVFGAGLGNYGIWSQALLGNTFKERAPRFLRMAGHEFGHMRSLDHCMHGWCNIGGYINLTELDEAPFIYCAEDTAKICYFSGISILEHCQRVMKFFNETEQKHPGIFNFNREKKILKQRIEVLSAK